MITQMKELYETASEKGSAVFSFEAEEQTFIRSFRRPERLILLGAGHIAQPLCRYAADLGFSVTVADDRPDFANYTRFPEADTVLCDDFSRAIEQVRITAEDYVAVITRGHRYDADCLRKILTGEFPNYLGMIGSKRRVRALFDLLEEEGFAREKLEKIHAPIGVEIGAVSVKEIAVSIAAELISSRRAGKRRPGGTVLATEDLDLSLLAFLADAQIQKALMIVYETLGSTPVKSGAMMAAARDGRTAGTIGGGCGEGEVLREARRLIGTGRSRCVTVDLTGDVAEEEGMVCGGKMKVLIRDVG